MRQHLALALTFSVGGCSLIYNPDNIKLPPIDGQMVDVEIRADASAKDLSLLEIFPNAIDEGAGTAGRKQVVMLKGHNFLPAYNVAVTVTPETPGAVTMDSFVASGNSDFIALELVAPDVEACHKGTSVKVAVKVEQEDGVGGHVMSEITDQLVVTCREALRAAPTSSTTLEEMYSVIDVSAPITFNTGGPKAILRSASSIKLAAINANAAAAAAGPGGGAAGATGTASGSGPSGGGGATNILAGGGGGAGFVIAGTTGTGTGGGGGGAPVGDVWISDYATNASSGGGVGAPTAVLPGNAGGGGGGTVELTAPGNVEVGAINANGAAGTAANLAGPGGDGSGGVVLIRSGGTLTSSTVSVATLAHTSANGNGISSVGRVRVEAAVGGYPGGAQIGPMFVAPGTKFVDQVQTFSLRGLANDPSAIVRVYDLKGQAVANAMNQTTYPLLFGTQGTVDVALTLKAGYNRVCVIVANGTPARAESLNCFEAIYLPQ